MLSFLSTLSLRLDLDTIRSLSTIHDKIHAKIDCRHIIYDALRVGDAKQHGVPPHIMSFLWVVGWVPYIIGMLLLVVTWVSFSSKNLLARPALTGNPLLFWGLAIPFIISSVIGSIVCGVNYWWYWVSMRVAVAVWSAFFLIIALFAGYYGNQTLVRLHKTRDSFNYHQQLRILIVVVAMFIACGICLGVQSFFLSRIDEIYQVFLLVTTLYRVCGLIVLVGSSIYVWVATTHTVSHSTRGGSRSERSARRSHAKRSSESGDSTEGRSSEAKSNNADESSQEDAESSSSAESGAQQLEEADDSELPNGKQESEHMLPHDDTSSSSLLDPYADDVAEDASTSSEESIS